VGRIIEEGKDGGYFEREGNRKRKFCRFGNVRLKWNG